MDIDAFVFDAYGTLYDVQSVYEVTEKEFPGQGDLITQVWRLKQLGIYLATLTYGRLPEFLGNLRRIASVHFA